LGKLRDVRAGEVTFLHTFVDDVKKQQPKLFEAIKQLDALMNEIPEKVDLNTLKKETAELHQEIVGTAEKAKKEDLHTKFNTFFSEVRFLLFSFFLLFFSFLQDQGNLFCVPLPSQCLTTLCNLILFLS
jgi:hypothetical protein